MGFGKIIRNVTKTLQPILAPLAPVFDKITPWNDKTEGLFGIGKITPWNDKDGNLVGNMLTGLTLAAVIGGGMHLANAGQTATTTAAANATTTTTGASSLEGALASLQTQPIQASTVINNAGQAALYDLAYGSPTGLYSNAAISNSILGMPTTVATGAAQTAATGGALSGAATPTSLFGTLTSKSVLPYTIIGGASLTGGVISGLGSYLSAKENAKVQREALALQKEQFDQQHSYGGSGIGEYLLRNMNKPTIRTAITTAQDAYLKMVSDPAYRQGFISAAAKFIHPDVASQINDFINNNSSQARLYTV